MKFSPFRSLSIQTIIALIYSVVIVLLVIIIGVISFMITTRTVDENTNEYVFQLVTQINYDIEYYLKNIENTINTIVVNDDFTNYFYQDDMDRFSSEEADSLSSDLNDFMASRSDIINIFLIREDGAIISNEKQAVFKENVQFTAEKWYKNSSNSDVMAISNAHIQNIIQDNYKWVVSCTTSIIDDISGEKIGVILVDLNFNLIDDMLNNLSLGEKGYMFITDSNGSIIYHPKHELLNSGIKAEETDRIVDADDGVITTKESERIKHYIVSTSKYSGWKVIGTVYGDELNPYEAITKQIYMIMIGLALAIAVLISIVISRSYLHPIKDLTDGMHQFKNGDLDTIIEVDSENEFGELASAFNDMTVRIKQLVIENKQKEVAKRRFELKSLQSQINPHFLYNTLDSIVWMAEAGLNDDVVIMTDSLAKLFRISINRGSKFVTVEQEIEHAESYLKIQKLRYGDKLDYKIDVEPSLLEFRIIKIIIQPIIENAIYHGIKKLAGSGLINIKVLEKDNIIRFIIEDNGVGMEEEEVLHLLDRSEHSNKSGIGVSNVDERIKLYYGENFGVTIESEVFEGTKVTLTVPKEYNREDYTNEEF